MFLNDIAEVLYAPRKAFKRIVASPKYLGVLVILILFIGLGVGYQYSQLSHVQIEMTSPQIGLTQFSNNATNWQAGQNVVLSNNFDDFFNNTVGLTYITPLDVTSYYKAYYFPVFGNNSLQISANNTNTVQVALSNLTGTNLMTGVDCTAKGFQNLAITMKLVEPASAPSNATLNLYSLSDNNYYTYDLTSALQNAQAVNQWGNLTIPVGDKASGWTETGSPTWQNITSLTLQFTYPNSQNITMRIGALFFGGQYYSVASDAGNLLYSTVLQYSLQILATWLVITGMVFVLFKAFKAQVTWRPIFIATGFTLIVLVIRLAVNIAATATLPGINFTYDTWIGAVPDLFGAYYYFPPMAVPVAASQATLNSIMASMATFRIIVEAMAVVSYVWLAGLVGLAVKEIKPDYPTAKCFAIAALSVAVTILVLVFLVHGI